MNEQTPERNNQMNSNVDPWLLEQYKRWGLDEPIVLHTPQQVREVLEMNRKQRKNQPRIVRIPLSELKSPLDAPQAEFVEILSLRAAINLQDTGHPFHHKTASGVIVDTDPTLEYWLSTLEPEQLARVRQAWEARIAPDAKPAVPVNRTWYGFDPYQK
jgi:hypothetical protein